MTQALYRQYRPRTWDQVVGQPHVVQTLRNEVVGSRVAHAYLFAGPRGTGKTSTARILAKAVNCLEPDLAQRPCERCAHCQAVNEGRFLDLIEIDAASNTSVEDVRSLRDKINFAPNQGRYKVYIVDEVHMLSTAAFNALLKTLEEPPPHAMFILATTEVHKIPATVLSRCQRHEFRRIPVNEIVAQLNALVDKEGLQVAEEALLLVARQSTGSLRDAISLLDQLTSAGEGVTLDLAQQVLGTAASQAVIEVIEAVLAGEAKAGLERIHQTLDAGSDPRQFARQVVDYLRSMLLIKLGSARQVEATPELKTQMQRHAEGLSVSELLRLIKVFNAASTEARLSWQPSLSLEMALVEAVTRPEAAIQAAPLAAAAQALPVSKAPRQPSPVAEKPTPASESEPLATSGTLYQASDAPAGGETPAPAQESAVTLEMISQKWRQLVDLVQKDNPNTAALLRSGKILGVKGGVLYYGLSEVLKVKCEKSENLDVIQSALQRVLGKPVPFRCVTATGKQVNLPPNIDSDGMVAAALRDLGGEVVDIK